MSDRGTVVLVDVYAPTTRLAEEFVAAGCEVVRLQSTIEVPPVYRTAAWPDIFAADLVHCGDLGATVHAVGSYSPVAVVAAGELGVELADQVSCALGLTSNGTTHSAARRDKYLQIGTLAANGLATARHLLVADAEQLASWHADLGGRVVIKPVRSAGNDGVRFCDTPSESTAAYRAVAGAVTVFANVGEGVVAQQYLKGTEYVVNTVSRDGTHRVTDVWRYVKISANGVRDRVSAAVSVPPGDSARAVLAPYTCAVLDALGIRHGPAHSEVMLTVDGPVLVEVGARISGADTAYYARLATGESQVERTVEAYLSPELFLAGAAAESRVRGHAAMAFLTSPVEGVLRSYPLLSAVQALESFHDVRLAVLPGQRLPLTVDDSSEPMLVGLAHEEQAVVARDLATLLYLDGHGFYDLEPTGSPVVVS